MNDIILNAIRYWLSIVTENDKQSLVYDCYLYYYSNINTEVGNWLAPIKEVVQKFGFSEVWDNQFIKTKKSFIKNIKISLEELY